jgi:peptidyl-prolyl cis-trans isomerase A (cyclophilin A)
MIRTPSVYTLAAAAVLAFGGLVQAGSKNPQVLLKTSMGDIQIELFPDKAPKSVENFLAYVKKGFYNNTVFHRVINNFMIQGGGFDKDLNEFETEAPIVNEAGNGLTNDRGTLAYARTNVVNSATSQFFINHKDNDFLNHRDNSAQGFGYAVFGKVVKGMDVVDKIATVKTGNKNGMGDVPVTPVVILSATLIETAK